MSGDEREAVAKHLRARCPHRYLDRDGCPTCRAQMRSDLAAVTARADDLAREVERIAADLERTLTKYETTNDYIDGCQAVSRDTATRLRAALDGGAAGGGAGE